MDYEFWHQRWQENRIGFHLPQPNPLLVNNLQFLELAKDARIFIPLSGKSLDIGYLLVQGFRIVAIELSQKAVDALIDELQLEFTQHQVGDLIHYQHERLDLFVGDVFHLNKNLLGHIDAIYDRAALVALPEKTRIQYAAHLTELAHVPQLIISYEYDQNSYEGPPFSVTEAEIRQHYQKAYQILLLEQVDLSDSFKGQNAMEKAWCLKPKIE
ncbi:thiopurine S-methyltransferase [Acinetobacter piscicola]|uniref:thiopurine S-methyltransferase n=1 Tax=Acinetobacter piscicola TaxID=2006115 RepID=UPI000B7E538A|nr:thiopurine S-methyltransferase [Acinetobacter piscicola]